MKNTNTKNVNRTNNKKARIVKADKHLRRTRAKSNFNYRPVVYDGRTYNSTSELVRYMLTHNKRAKRTQSEIARICGVSQPCVCQLATTLK
jgi:hypothetical protein